MPVHGKPHPLGPFPEEREGPWDKASAWCTYVYAWCKKLICAWCVCMYAVKKCQERCGCTGCPVVQQASR